MKNDPEIPRQQLTHHGIALPMDDITTGQFVSVLGSNLPASMSRGPGRCDRPFDLNGRRVTPGTSLIVLKLSLPFVLCGIVGPKKTMSGPLVIDMRAFQLCRLSEDFIRGVVDFDEKLPTSLASNENGAV